MTRLAPVRELLGSEYYERLPAETRILIEGLEKAIRALEDQLIVRKQLQALTDEQLKSTQSQRDRLLNLIIPTK